MSPNPEYVLGDGQRELQRLALQAQFWGGATLELLKRARIGPGMRVLDLGCGAGDVSLLAATLVGWSGSIVGIDRSPAAVVAARAKVEAAGLPEPALIVRSKVEPAPAPSGTRYIAETVRSLLPMMERLGVASAAEVEIETLADRMQEALADVQASLLSPAVVGTCSTVTS